MREVRREKKFVRLRTPWKAEKASGDEIVGTGTVAVGFGSQAQTDLREL